MADKIKETFKVESELDKQSGGIFDVYVDDTLIFSKHNEDRFPEEQEILDSLASRAS